MRILIWNDVEGIAGITDQDYNFTDEKYMKLTTAEINAVIKGLKKGGATHIDIFDGHGMGDNLILEELNNQANYLGGGWMVILANLIRTEKFQQYDALVLVGMHAQEGTIDGFIAHTNSKLTALYLNEMPIGEIEQAAWLAGYFNVPTIFISGDEAAIKEANKYLPGIEVVITKKKENENFVSFPLDDVYLELEQKACKALKNINELQPFIFGGPIKVEILFAFEDAAEEMALLPGFEKKDERTVIYHAKDYLEAFWAYQSFRPILKTYESQFFQQILSKVQEKFNLDDENDIQPLFNETYEEFMKKKKSFPSIKF
ncbi:MAG: M55 family metallopeptidase [Candidatus Odinarchaeota archaeon]